MAINWYIKPHSTPVVLRNCSRCGCLSAFVCSNRFRINAQQKNIDVWLIYKCKTCQASWNMTIFSRVKPEEIGKALYNGLLNNDVELAWQYAFDHNVMNRNNVRPCYDDMTYDVEGDVFLPELLKQDDVTLHISSPYRFDLRLAKLLREKLGISRCALERCFQSGAVISDDFGFRPGKSKIILRGDMTLHFNRAAADIIEKKA